MALIFISLHVQQTMHTSTKDARTASISRTSTIPTEMFTRQIPRNLKSATVKLPMLQKSLLIFKSVIPTGDLALFSRHTRTLVGKFARFTDLNFEEFEVGNGKNYLHPQKSPIFFSRSVKILVRMVHPSKEIQKGRQRRYGKYHVCRRRQFQLKAKVAREGGWCGVVRVLARLVQIRLRETYIKHLSWATSICHQMRSASPKPHPSNPHPCNTPQAKTEVALQSSESCVAEVALQHAPFCSADCEKLGPLQNRKTHPQAK